MSPATAYTEGALLREVVIGRRFNGPPDSANGGYACGVLARFLPSRRRSHCACRRRSAAARRTLRRGGRGAACSTATPSSPKAGRRTAIEVEPPARPSFDEAVAAGCSPPVARRSPSALGLLRLQPRSAATGVSRVAWSRSPAPTAVTQRSFVPDAERRRGRPGLAGGRLGRARLPQLPAGPMERGPVALLGRMAASREREIRAGERLVAVGWSLGGGRAQAHSASALLDANGDVVARARATWIELRG